MDVDQFPPTLQSFGRKGRMIDYSSGDVSLGDNVKAVVVCAAGDVVYRARDEVADAITMTALTAGTIIPHLIGLIVQSGTTAELATVED
jgi:hypothetical protein